MDFPIDMIESITGAMKTLTQGADIARWIADKYQKRSASRPGGKPQGDDSMDDCVLKTLYLLRQESELKKLEHIKCFAQNTILSDTCNLDTYTILRFLMDIEQMSWRQFCLLEGFRRKESNGIEIEDSRNSDINAISIETEIKTLINFNYLRSGNHDLYSYTSTDFENIYIRELGEEISSLLNLESIKISEIGKAFGTGRITESKTY